MVCYVRPVVALCGLALLVSAFMALALPIASADAGVPPSGAADALFIENVGQFAPHVRFQVQGADQTLWLTDDALWLVADAAQPAPRAQDRLHAPDAGPHPRSSIRMGFVDRNPHARVAPFGRQSATVSYLRGNDPADWRRAVPVWRGVRYVDLYPGIDFEISMEQGKITQQVLARPGANLDQVRLDVDGADQVQINGSHMRLLTGGRTITWPLFRPPQAVSHARVAGRRVTAPFAAPAHVQAAQATPQDDIVWSLQPGGSSTDRGDGVAVDAQGSLYVVATSLSADFPTQAGYAPAYNGDVDMVALKLRGDGTLIYATYMGGADKDYAQDIAVADRNTPAPSAVIVGQTRSADFPTTSGALDATFAGGTCGVAPNQFACADGMLLRLSADGTGLVFATFVGGDADDALTSVAFGTAGDVFVAGWANSPDFPTTIGAYDRAPNGDYDAVVLKFAPDASTLIYSTLLGGSGIDVAYGIAVDDAGAVYVTGDTWSPNFPASPCAVDRALQGVNDSFVTKLSADGSHLIYSTFLGGSADEYGNQVVVDSNGEAYVTGMTNSADFPTTAGAVDTSWNGDFDVYVTKLNASGSAYVYSTFLGGSGRDGGFSNRIALQPGVDTDSHLTISPGGAVYFSGETASADFPTTAGSRQPTPGGGKDGFVTQLSADGSTLLYSSFLGGPQENDLRGIAVGGAGAVFLTGTTGDNNVQIIKMRWNTAAPPTAPLPPTMPDPCIVQTHLPLLAN